MKSCKIGDCGDANVNCPLRAVAAKVQSEAAKGGPDGTTSKRHALRRQVGQRLY
jgi:hypothetical protein